jgi:CHASE3 domain sensor protein
MRDIDMIEALMLTAIGLLQGYILTRIDSLDSRLDHLKSELERQGWKLEYLRQKIHHMDADVNNRSNPVD